VKGSKTAKKKPPSQYGMNCLPFLGHKKWEAVQNRGRFAMTEKKRSGIKVPNIKVEGEDEGNTPFVMRLVRQPVLPQDVYSAAEVARLLGSSRSRSTTTQKTR